MVKTMVPESLTIRNMVGVVAKLTAMEESQ